MDSSALQLPLPMLTVYEAPRFLTREEMACIRSYRDAVRTCWRLGEQLRGRRMLQAVVADATGMRASHLTEYLSADPTKREMPMRYVLAFEAYMGNRAITQFHNNQAGIPIEQLLDQLEKVRRLVA